jgi:gephyrin
MRAGPVVPFDPRTEFHRVVVKARKEIGMLEVWSPGSQRSSRVASLQGENGFVVVPPVGKSGEGTDGKKGSEKGEWAEAILIGSCVKLCSWLKRYPGIWNSSEAPF